MDAEIWMKFVLPGTCIEFTVDATLWLCQKGVTKVGRITRSFFDMDIDPFAVANLGDPSTKELDKGLAW